MLGILSYEVEEVFPEDRGWTAAGSAAGRRHQVQHKPATRQVQVSKATAACSGGEKKTAQATNARICREVREVAWGHLGRALGLGVVEGALDLNELGENPLTLE